MDGCYKTWVIALLLLGVCGSALAEDSPEARADEIIRLLREGKFRQISTSYFHYPPDYSPTELAKEQAAVCHFLEHLFQEIGSVQTVNHSDLPAAELIDLGVSAGYVPYWSAHPELNRIQVIRYEAQVENDGKVFFSMAFVRPKDQWEVRAFTFGLLTSRPGAVQRINELASKLYPLGSPQPTRAPDHAGITVRP